MSRDLRLRCLGVALVTLGVASSAFAQSGQRNYGKVSVEPAVDYSTGNTVYLLTPEKAPFPSKANPKATAPLYLIVYPPSSTVSASDLNCQPDNCDHVNVLPFPSPVYTPMPGNSQACTDFNGGDACSLVKGHDHLVGIANTQGDFNVAWSVKLVVFTPAATTAEKNTRITTIGQMNALVNSGHLVVNETPITFNCSSTSVQTYENGTPVSIQFP